MKKKHLFWLLLPSYWILTMIAIFVVAISAFQSMSDLYCETLKNDILTRALLFKEQVKPLIENQKMAQSDALCKQIGHAAATRFTIVMTDGAVYGDSDESPENMEFHGDRPEIRQSFVGQIGMDQRYSRTLKQEMMYIAVPLSNDDEQILCAVRASLPMTSIREQLNKMTGRIIIYALFAGLLAMGTCVLVVRRISAPLRSMSWAAMQFAEGDFSRKIPAQKAAELNQLARSLNTMSEQLNATLLTLHEQKNEQQAVLASMDEGVLAIDRRDRVIHMNQAACDILNTNTKSTNRLLIQEVVRYSNLQEFIKTILGTQKTLSLDMQLLGEKEKKVQARGTVLRNTDKEPIGALIILRDVTKLRYLETVRSDFVSNVSHELKTPITSIKGFVETLLSDDWGHKQETIRFLEIINQQASRMNAIIDDLLTLSRLEQKNGTVLKEVTQLQSILNNAAYLCQHQAEKKQTKIIIKCNELINLNANAPLLEQAIVNLIINAIKYSEPNKTIHISSVEEENNVLIAVKDEGFGIEHKHINRLFERFYRVDTARSRKLGGTGLGLSIVKHIIQVHEGSIKVESYPQAGTTFIIKLPTQTQSEA